MHIFSIVHGTIRFAEQLLCRCAVKVDVFLRRCAAALLLMLHLHGIAAPVPAALSSDFIHTAWGGLQGAPVDVLKFAQGADGWLWIATATGLYRYDGAQFERTDSVYGHRLVSSDVLGLAAARDGALWAGYRLGGVTVFRKGGARTYMEADGLPRGAVSHIEAAPDGSVWVATRSGVGVLAPGASRFTALGGEAGLPNKLVFQVLFGRDGTQWLATVDGVFFRRPGEARFSHAWPRTALMAMAEGPDGTLWASDSAGSYYRVGTTAPAPGDTPAPELKANGMWFDREGTAWLLRADSVERRLDPVTGAAGSPLQKLTQATGLSGALPQAFFQDREDNIWIGTSAGLDRLRRSRLKALPVDGALDHPGMVPGPDGDVWVGDFGGDARSATPAGVGKTVFKGHFTASHWAPDGALWVGNDQVLQRRAPDGSLTRVALPEGARGLEPQAIQQDAHGGLWVSFSGGALFRLAQGAWTSHGGLAGFPADLATAMALDDRGRLWMGHARSGISLVEGGAGKEAVRRLGPAAGLQPGAILALYRDGAAMWVGGEHGTALYRDGRFLALHGRGGETFRGMSGIVRLPGGDLWLHGADGIYRIDAAGLAQWLRDPAGAVAFERFDALDGLRGHAPQLRPLPSLVRAADGMLWFSTGSSIALLDPAHIRRNALPPPVQIRSVATGAVEYEIHGPGALRLDKGSNSMRLTFTANSLAIPERVRFRYRLDGVDQGWQEPRGRRAVSYTNLAPGSYRFEVTAANEDGVWNPQPAVLDIDIPPTFTQTRWFLLLLAAAATLLLYAAYALRIRYLTRRMQVRLQGRIEERSRIARSLHDTLLQSVQGLLMSFNAHVHHVPPGSRERADLERTLALAGRLLVEGRDQIMDLRASASPEEMRLALQAFGRELAEYSGHAFEIRVVGRARALKPQVSDEVYAIGREALFNASRHADACQVMLTLDYGREAFTLRIHDDGRGLDQEVAAAGHRPGHWGLAGMRERAAAIGAHFDLASAAGKGTDIAVTLPAALAYQFLLPAPGRLLRRWWQARTA